MREPGEHCCRIAGRPVVGIDEVGRGSLAGSVTAAALWFPDMAVPEGVDDSKAIPSRARRAEVAIRIRTCAVFAIGHATSGEIDAVGILKATHMAMERAWIMLQAPRDALVIVDGVDVPARIRAEAVAMKAADARCPTVAAASVIAKVERDQAMDVLAGPDDPYGWRSNAGYGSRTHMEALARLGPCEHHRMSFRPVRMAGVEGDRT